MQYRKYVWWKSFCNCVILGVLYLTNMIRTRIIHKDMKKLIQTDHWIFVCEYLQRSTHLLRERFLNSFSNCQNFKIRGIFSKVFKFELKKSSGDTRWKRDWNWIKPLGLFEYRNWIIAYIWVDYFILEGCLMWDRQKP